jgi:hypothetical protein
MKADRADALAGRRRERLICSHEGRAYWGSPQDAIPRGFDIILLGPEKALQTLIR